jgi:hypothetical protein
MPLWIGKIGMWSYRTLAGLGIFQLGQVFTPEEEIDPYPKDYTPYALGLLTVTSIFFGYKFFKKK